MRASAVILSSILLTLASRRVGRRGDETRTDGRGAGRLRGDPAPRTANADCLPAAPDQDLDDAERVRERSRLASAPELRLGRRLVPAAPCRPRAGWLSPKEASTRARRPRGRCCRISSAGASRTRPVLRAELGATCGTGTSSRRRADDLDRRAPPGLHAPRHRNGQGSVPAATSKLFRPSLRPLRSSRRLARAGRFV